MKGKQLHFFESEEDRNINKRHTITLPLDTLIMLSIVMLLLLTIVLFIGIERGRKIACPVSEKNIVAKTTEMPAASGAEPAIQEQLNPVVSKPQAAMMADSNIAVKAQDLKTKETTMAVAEIQKPVIVKNGKYLIQVASFAKESMAREEVKILEKSGFQASIAQKGKYTVILVGNFNDIQEAQKNVETLKKKYKDCFIRRLES